MVKRKKLKIGLIILAAAIGLLLAVHVLLLLLIGPPWQGMREMERDFNRNKETIFIARDYLAGFDYDFLRYPPFSGERGMMSTGTRGVYVEVEDYNARNAMDLLLRRGYQTITKDGNFIILLRWRNMDNGRGIVYSIDRTQPNESVLPFLIRLEPLSEEGWFYYEEDFNEFRRRQQNDN